ncbi:hypothetical protein T11_160 [Trichinella zimbabwensis]|uniref:Uncharacterized protein n=1 Tax=Trichinella zimbabwensis TaxID=268475 RepID=A0A0V1H2X4_9BILA|nr:hypothetical protein T11_160 [Trichinella zimbabwensis]
MHYINAYNTSHALIRSLRTDRRSISPSSTHAYHAHNSKSNLNRKFQINLRQEWNEIEKAFVFSLSDLDGTTFAWLRFGNGDSMLNLPKRSFDLDLPVCTVPERTHEIYRWLRVQNEKFISNRHANTADTLPRMVDRLSNFHSEEIRKTLETCKHERASIDPRFNESTPRNLPQAVFTYPDRSGSVVWAAYCAFCATWPYLRGFNCSINGSNSRALSVDRLKSGRRRVTVWTGRQWS